MLRTKRKTIKVTRTRKRKVQEMSSDEYESDLEAQEDVEVEILDSIEVKLQ